MQDGQDQTYRKDRDKGTETTLHFEAEVAEGCGVGALLSPTRSQNPAMLAAELCIIIRSSTQFLAQLHPLTRDVCD
jgi:hypothetical protein